MPHFVKLPENTKGYDYIITDVNGEHLLLIEFIKILQPDDRLFLGNLIGISEEYQIIRGIIETQRAKRKSAGLPSQIFIFATEREYILKKYLQMKLTPEDFNQDDIRKIESLCSDTTHEFVKNETYFSLTLLMQFLNSLPIMYFIEGKRPFVTLQAKRALSDKALYQRSGKDKVLSHPEFNYAIYGKYKDKQYEDEMETEACHAKSIPTYCAYGSKTVRTYSNHINLNFRYTNPHSVYFCVVNHTTGRCGSFGRYYNSDNGLYYNFLNEMAPRFLLRHTNAVERHINFRLPVAARIEELITKYQKKSRLFISLLNHELYSNRVKLLRNARNEILAATVLDDVIKNIFRVLLQNISFIKNSYKWNKDNFGELHTKLLILYPELAVRIMHSRYVIEFNQSPAGINHPITLENIKANIEEMTPVSRSVSP